MKVMVTQNVETDLNITNGVRGVIVDIILHPEEPPCIITDSVAHLKHLPSYILVKLCRTRTSQLPGLEHCVIPVVPVCRSYGIRYMGPQGVAVSRRVRRMQYLVTSAYAFTDYRSQGQTISHVIMDIAKPFLVKAPTFLQTTPHFLILNIAKESIEWPTKSASPSKECAVIVGDTHPLHEGISSIEHNAT
ncbi:hypothetical protein EV401DRAFT_1938657 [Pisolithus croceorrhizus]|nr:hypothetical protein EV401DRAFT_1938657 [Pisolithus croceorrhizus]